MHERQRNIIGTNCVQKPTNQIKMTARGNLIYFSGLILGSKNYEYKSKQKHISVKGKLNEKYESRQKRKHSSNYRRRTHATIH